MILKIDQDGDLIWENVICASPQDDMVESIHATPDEGYVFGGRTNATAGTGDFWLVKLAPEFTIDEEYNEKVITITHFPNPVTDDVTFKYTFKNTIQHEKIYNLHGQLLDTIEGNNDTAAWLTKNHKSGMYFYSIKSGDYSAKNKMIIMK